MGQKVHPVGFRLGIIRDWDAKWFATGKNYATNLVADQKVRRFLRGRLSNAAVSRIELLRSGNSLNVTLHTGRPGIVIGKKGEDIERLRNALMVMNGGPVRQGHGGWSFKRGGNCSDRMVSRGSRAVAYPKSRCRLWIR